MQVPSENLLKMCNGSIGKLMKVNENLEEYNAVESTTKQFSKWENTKCSKNVKPIRDII